MVSSEKNKDTKKKRTVGENDFAYFDLLVDNSPQAFTNPAESNYNSEAAILHRQIKNENVLNLALVAKLGAGKSSVINTYLTSYRNKKSGQARDNKFARVSLATFNEVEYDEQTIERSILQQLLYSQKKSKLPNSQIERTNKTPLRQSLLRGLLATMLIVSAVLSGIEISDKSFISGPAWIKFALLGLVGVSLFLSTTYLFHYQKLKKIKYKDLEADFQLDDKGNETKPTSLINKFVNEVLYFFECVKIDLVIFEDLDRLPSTEVFAKLRELNTIINCSRKRHDKITFLYAVKDDLFKTEEERAKFFEFILPVIPVVNPVTTANEMEKRFKQLPSRMGKLPLKFIKSVSGFIPDMRILKNIFNDYIIMYHRIIEDEKARTGMSRRKLFTLCIYKNLFPYDYALLEKRKGLIPMVVDMDRLLKVCTKDNQEKIANAKKRIEAIKEENLNSFDELKNSFIGQITRMDKQRYGYGTIDSFTITTFVGLDFTAIRHPSTHYRLELPHGQTEILALDGKRYEDKEKAIKDKCAKGIEQANVEIGKLEKVISLLQNKSFRELIELQGIEICFPKYLKETYKAENKIELSDDQIEDQIKFLRVVVVQGLIDEHYIEYTSNHKAQMITVKDHKFCMAVQGRTQDFDRKLDDVATVVERLDDNDFKYLAILNRTLLAELPKVKLVSKEEKSKKYDNLLKLLKSNSDEVLEIIRKFVSISGKEEIDSFVQAIVVERPILFAELRIDDQLPHNKLDEVLVSTIRHTLTFETANYENMISAYVGEHPEYLRLFNDVGDSDKVVKMLDELKPCFEKLIGNPFNKYLKHIVAKNLYKVTLKILETVLRTDSEQILKDVGRLTVAAVAELQNLDKSVRTPYYKAELNPAFYTANYTMIFTDPHLPVGLVGHIDANVDDYINNILLNDKISLVAEVQENMESLLKNDNASIELRTKLVPKINFQIDDISEFSEQLFEALINNNKIKSTWANVLVVFQKKGFGCIKDYLVRNLRFDGETVFADHTVAKLDFAKAILHNLGADELRKLVLPAFIFDLSELSIVNVEDDVLEVFIKQKRIRYRKHDLPHLISKPKSLFTYLKQYMKNVLIDREEFFDSLISSDNEEEASKVIGTIISFSGIVEIKKHLLTESESFVDTDGYSRAYVDFFLAEKIAVPTTILWQFANSKEVTEQEKHNLLCQSIKIISRSDAKELQAYCKSLGKGWGKIFETTEKARVPKTEANRVLLEALQSNKFIKYNPARIKEEYIVEALV